MAMEEKGLVCRDWFSVNTAIRTQFLTELLKVAHLDCEPANTPDLRAIFISLGI